MVSIFDIPWELVDLDHLREFLAGADEEGLTWEAKAGDPREGESPRLRADRLTHSACGFANQIGGFVIAGARKEGGSWELPGVEMPGDEPGTWLDQVLETLRPIPRYEHKHWSLDDGLVAAVVRVEPLTRTPCMTRDGQVFERLSGRTERVTDPVRLHELITRGERARENAQALAHRAATSLFEHPGSREGRSVWVSLGFAPASHDPDIGSRLFTDSFNKRLHRVFGDRFFGEPQMPAPSMVAPAIRQSYLQLAGGEGPVYWVTRANWDGTVGVLAALGGEDAWHHSLFDFIVWPAWRAAADLVETLGGYGEAFAQLSVQVHQIQTVGDLVDAEEGKLEPPPKSTIYAKLPSETHIRRWSEVREPTSDEIGSVQREFQRAAGTFTFEGAPEPPT